MYIISDLKINLSFLLLWTQLERMGHFHFPSLSYAVFEEQKNIG